MRIRKVQTPDRVLNQLQQNIAQVVEPVLSNAVVQGSILESVSLASGTNHINHGLGRTLLGWIPVRVRGSATLYDQQDTNTSPTVTLTLVASAAVVVDLYVF